MQSQECGVRQSALKDTMALLHAGAHTVSLSVCVCLCVRVGMGAYCWSGPKKNTQYPHIHL